jgi:hypothetical protein
MMGVSNGLFMSIHKFFKLKNIEIPVSFYTWSGYIFMGLKMNFFLLLLFFFSSLIDILVRMIFFFFFFNF